MHSIAVDMCGRGGEIREFSPLSKITNGWYPPNYPNEASGLISQGPILSAGFARF